MLFAQQAAAAIVNARAHRAERRARANLEALVETCPVGVVVLDAASGAPLTFNREARRILAGLHIEGRSEAELAQVLICRRADGREETLDELRNAETVRAEELELSVPDGRSVRTLVNATPIPSAEGGVETVVVTVQDLAPLQELARSRGAFLSMVSHELRAPLAAVKGSAATALGASRDPDRAELRQFLRIVEEQADRMDALIGDLVDVGRIGAGTLAVDAAPSQVEAHGGRIRAESGGVGRGLRVTFTLPVAEAPAPAPTPPAPTPPAPTPHAGEKIPVLVVDDDPNALRDALAAAGYAPAVTGDPEDIPALVEAKRPRLALLDLALPGADGIALMQTLPALAGLPVIKSLAHAV